VGRDLEKGETMSRRAINFEHLSKADKEELKQLLQHQKKALQDAIRPPTKSFTI